MKTDPADLLRAHGLHVTAQRLAVLRAVARHPHGSAEAIAKSVREEIGTVSIQAVYDALHQLTEKGILRRVQPPGSPALFDPRAGDSHDHVICRGCGAMVDVESTTGAAPSLRAAEASGFTIDAAEVVYWGLCPKCRKPAKKPRR